MAPEQARGRVVDRRADIWAFGVVLYEMLTGQRAFEGEDISITLASVLKEDVRWVTLPGDLPAPLLKLLRRCLEKDRRRRLSWIGEARLTLEDPATLEPAVAASPALIAPPCRPRRCGDARCRGPWPQSDSVRRSCCCPCGRPGARGPSRRANAPYIL